MRIVHKIIKKKVWLQEQDWIQEMEAKPETLENATEGSQWADDWFQEVQNQTEPTPSQIETLAPEFDIFQPQTAQELQPLKKRQFCIFSFYFISKNHKSYLFLDGITPYNMVKSITH